ncbi:hypothetical protein B0H16DRAFT_1805605 [Mycena metata]|uniref:Thiaminase-2/PQQC domain-containing protein n=1 Tax=Mycena metata TaxID=1033252 RepID=A0AAD7NJF5_9AGAR|nr:hypothetical protein B0H16DRAFT_1805605 [Mycena metata]
MATCQGEASFLLGIPQHTPPSASATASVPSASAASAAPPITPRSSLQVPADAVAELLERNKDAYNNVINHPFPRALGDGTASLDGFRHYMIVSKLLAVSANLHAIKIHCAWFRVLAIEAFDVRYKIEYQNKLKETCRTMLGVSQNTMEATPRSVELDTTERVYRKVLQDDNAWLGYYIILLPCVTYWEIAKRLMHDPATAKNVVYHRAWTEVNYDDSSVAKYIKFINANIAAKGGVDHWNWTFNIACNLESQIFNIGLRAPTPYEIIPNGTYSIHTSSAKSLVLTVQDATGFLRQTSQWLVFATKTGCTFKNVGTGLYLGTSAALDHGEYRILQAVSDPYCWWINPSSNQGPSVYQIHDSANLLSADIRNYRLTRLTQIIAHENSDAPCQMWFFDDSEFKQTESTQTYADDDKLPEPRSAEPEEQSQQADATIKRLEAEKTAYVEERNLLRKELEDVRSALDGVESEFPTLAGTKPATMIKMVEEHMQSKPLRIWEREKREHTCYWERFSPSLESKFDSASFNPAPIPVSKEQGRPTFILQPKGGGYLNHSLKVISDGWPFHADDISSSKKYEVLVGDSSRLSWIPIDKSWIPNDGPPKIKSLDHKPVTGWDVGMREYNETFTFIGRFSYLGNFYAGQVEKGWIRAIGSPPREFRSIDQPFEVLCYNPSEDK